MFGQIVGNITTEVIKSPVAQEVTRNLVAGIGNEHARGAGLWIASLAQNSKYGPQIVGELAGRAVVAVAAFVRE